MCAVKGAALVALLPALSLLRPVAAARGDERPTPRLVCASTFVGNAFTSKRDDFGSAVAGVRAGASFSVGVPHDDDGRHYQGTVWRIDVADDDGDASKPMHGSKISNQHPSSASFFGASIATLGDVDGNGAEDIAVGAPGMNRGRGGAYVLLLDASGEVLSTQSVLCEGAAPEDHCGSAIAAIGDMDGDGLTELALGASGDNSEQGGAIHFFSLRADGTAVWHRIVEPPPAAAQPGASFGRALAAMRSAHAGSSCSAKAGCASLAVGAPGADGGRGLVYLLEVPWAADQPARLRPGGGFVSPSQYARNGAGDLVRGAAGPDEHTGGIFGESVANVGDIDGNGEDDLLIGAPASCDGSVHLHGRAWLGLLGRDGAASAWQPIGEYPPSSRSRKLVHVGGFSGSTRPGDGFGCAVGVLASRRELLVGAPSADGGGVWRLQLCPAECGDGSRFGYEAGDGGGGGDAAAVVLAASATAAIDASTDSAEPTHASADPAPALLAEPCDDGNRADGDGCSGACAVEPGFACDGGTWRHEDSCSPVCGDGLRVRDEACDDGNTADGDGCSSACEIESGWSCSAPKYADADANADAAADAAAAAAANAAFSPVPQSVCVETCGDARLRGAETCDDGNALDGDGCSARCATELGFACTVPHDGEPSECSSVCGDGLSVGAEGCDDGGLEPGDGCSATCSVEEGWACEQPADGGSSSCSPLCGDGRLVAEEVCDDGNLQDGDGCSARCSIERGFVLRAMPIRGVRSVPVRRADAVVRVGDREVAARAPVRSGGVREPGTAAAVAVALLRCPVGTASADDAAQCVACPAGMFNSESAAECAPCPPGTWGNEEGAEACVACGEPAWCTGGRACAAGRMGVACAHCAPGFFLDGAACALCPEAPSPWPWMALLIALALGSAWVVLRGALAPCARETQHAFGVCVLVIATWQAWGFTLAYDVGFPKYVRKMGAWVRQVTSLSIEPIVAPAECVHAHAGTFGSRWALMTAFPALVGAVLGALALVSASRGRRRALGHGWRTALDTSERHDSDSDAGYSARAAAARDADAGAADGQRWAAAAPRPGALGRQDSISGLWPAAARKGGCSAVSELEPGSTVATQLAARVHAADELQLLSLALLLAHLLLAVARHARLVSARTAGVVEMLMVGALGLASVAAVGRAAHGVLCRLRAARAEADAGLPSPGGRRLGACSAVLECGSSDAGACGAHTQLLLLWLSITHVFALSLSLQPFACTREAEGVWSLDAFPRMRCWQSAEHRRLVLLGALFGCVYGVAVPACACAVLRAAKLRMAGQYVATIDALDDVSLRTYETHYTRLYGRCGAVLAANPRAWWFVLVASLALRAPPALAALLLAHRARAQCAVALAAVVGYALLYLLYFPLAADWSVSAPRAAHLVGEAARALAARERARASARASAAGAHVHGTDSPVAKLHAEVLAAREELREADAAVASAHAALRRQQRSALEAAQRHAHARGVPSAVAPGARGSTAHLSLLVQSSLVAPPRPLPRAALAMRTSAPTLGGGVGSCLGSRRASACSHGGSQAHDELDETLDAAAAAAAATDGYAGAAADGSDLGTSFRSLRSTARAEPDPGSFRIRAAEPRRASTDAGAEQSARASPQAVRAAWLALASGMRRRARAVRLRQVLELEESLARSLQDALLAAMRRAADAHAAVEAAEWGLHVVVDASAHTEYGSSALGACLPGPLARALASCQLATSCWLEPYHRHKLGRLHAMREAEARWLFALAHALSGQQDTPPASPGPPAFKGPAQLVAAPPNDQPHGADQLPLMGSGAPPSEGAAAVPAAAGPHAGPLTPRDDSAHGRPGAGIRTCTPCEYASELL